MQNDQFFTKLIRVVACSVHAQKKKFTSEWYFVFVYQETEVEACLFNMFRKSHLVFRNKHVLHWMTSLAEKQSFNNNFI